MKLTLNKNNRPFATGVVERGRNKKHYVFHKAELEYDCCRDSLHLQLAADCDLCQKLGGLVTEFNDCFEYLIEKNPKQIKFGESVYQINELTNLAGAIQVFDQVLIEVKSGETEGFNLGDYDRWKRFDFELRELFPLARIESTLKSAAVNNVYRLAVNSFFPRPHDNPRFNETWTDTSQVYLGGEVDGLWYSRILKDFSQESLISAKLSRMKLGFADTQ